MNFPRLYCFNLRPLSPAVPPPPPRVRPAHLQLLHVVKQLTPHKVPQAAHHGHKHAAVQRVPAGWGAEARGKWGRCWAATDLAQLSKHWPRPPPLSPLPSPQIGAALVQAAKQGLSQPLHQPLLLVHGACRGGGRAVKGGRSGRGAGPCRRVDQRARCGLCCDGLARASVWPPVPGSKACCLPLAWCRAGRREASILQLGAAHRASQWLPPESTLQARAQGVALAAAPVPVARAPT